MTYGKIKYRGENTMWNTLVEFAGPIIAIPYVRAAGVAVVRIGAGWLENTVIKGQKFNFRKALETFFRLVPQLAGATAMGIPEAALLTDMAYVGYKKKK